MRAGTFLRKTIYKKQIPVYRIEVSSHTADKYFGDDEHKFYPHAHSIVYNYIRTQRDGIIITGYWKAAQFRMDY
jgi:hypothetical protein